MHRAAVAAAPDDWRAHVSLGQWLYGQARYDEAIKEWELARTLTPDNILVLRNLGGAYHAVDRTEDAATMFQRALEIEPQATIYNNLATMRFFQGRYAESVRAFEKSDRAEPDLLPVLGQSRRRISSDARPRAEGPRRVHHRYRTH